MFEHRLAGIRTTMESHYRFPTPLVTMAILGQDPSQDLFVPANPFASPCLPSCSLFLSHKDTARALLACTDLRDYDLNGARFTLLSSSKIFDDIYRYVLLCVVQLPHTPAPLSWLHVEQFLASPPAVPEAYIRLLRHLHRRGMSDDLTIADPRTTRDTPDPERLRLTRLAHAATLCCPLITAGAVLVLDDAKGRPRGVILQRRGLTLPREPGRWHLAAGFVEAHESAAQCIARETYEELGLVLEPSAVRRELAILEPSPMETRWINWPIIFEAHTTIPPEAFWRGPNPEVDAVAVFSLANLPAPAAFAFGEGTAIRELITNALGVPHA